MVNPQLKERALKRSTIGLGKSKSIETYELEAGASLVYDYVLHAGGYALADKPKRESCIPHVGAADILIEQCGERIVHIFIDRGVPVCVYVYLLSDLSPENNFRVLNSKNMETMN